MTTFIERVKDKFSAFSEPSAILIAIIDIILLSLLFFFVYNFIRKRRTLSILIGVLCVVLLKELAGLLKLSALYGFLNAFCIPGMIILVIILQSDIRSMLEKIGGFVVGVSKTVAHGFKPESGRAESEAILKAIMRLSATKTGALIVLENNTGIDDVCQSGVKIDAAVSHELICNLFFSPAPLHDGAIVISRKRINSAGCFLPSFSDPELNSSFGSRHRAAIGMSRDSDAGVIVISEEDGRISYAFAGELSLGVDENRLRSILRSYYGLSNKSGKGGNGK